MAISKGSAILGSDVGIARGATATAAGINSSFGTSVTKGSLITPIAGFNNRYFIQNGNFSSGITHVARDNGGGVYQNWTDRGDYIYLSTYQGGTNGRISAFLYPAITFNGQWKSLSIDAERIGDQSWFGLSEIDNTNPAAPNNDGRVEFAAWGKLMDRRDTWSSRYTTTIDVSKLRGTYYLAIELKGWLYYTSGSGGAICIYNFYLSN